MRLANASKRMDRTVAQDAYAPATTFRCQLAPLDLYKIDGTAVKRRQMSCAADVTIPARKVIDIGGQRYLVGGNSPDYFAGGVVRQNFVLQGADYLANLTSIEDALLGNPAAQAYVSRDFNKYSTDERDSSEYHPQYQIFLSDSEAAPANSLIQLGGIWHFVRQSYVSVSGLLVALSNELPEPVFETIAYGAQTYDPITDSYSGTPTSLTVMRVRWTEHFRYLTRASEDYVRGDQQVFLLKSAATPSPSDNLPLSDGVWRVLSVQDEGAVWSCHVRRG